MNEQLKSVMEFIQQNENISAEDKSMLLTKVRKASSDLEIAEFKLERTEKVKRTTAILLEETIEELEQKRKAVEAQNRELEIESSLERVRTIAMGMRKPDDMLEVCRTISQQSESLGIREIRNVQTAIIYEDKGTYLNYEYYAKHDKLLITEVDYKNHELQSVFANRMLRGAEELFSSGLTGNEVQEWYAYQKTTNQFADSYLENAQSLNYYFYSLGQVALGMSTYAPLSEEEISLFKRFRNVFDLAYRRFLDIEKAEAQAREAKIEASLERVRAQALSMGKPDDLPGICEVLYNELLALGFDEIRNAMINIHDDEKASFVNYDYSDEIGQSINQLAYNIHPLIEKQIKQIRSSADAFSITCFAKQDLNDWIAFRKKIGEKDDPRIENTDALYYYFYSIGKGSVGISTFSSITDEKLSVLKRFRNVFDFAYRRYTDVAQAEAQAREAQIEVSLERIRAAAMAMRDSSELSGIIYKLYGELTKLDTRLDRCFIMIVHPENKGITWWLAGKEGLLAENGFFVQMNQHPTHLMYLENWTKRTKKWQYLFEGKEKSDWDRFGFAHTELSRLPDFIKQDMASVKKVYLSGSSDQFGSLVTGSLEPLPDENQEIISRFAVAFNQAFVRFLDLQKAEAQAREAQIEAALERVRSRTMAMQKSDELAETSAVLFQQLIQLGIEPNRLYITIIKDDQANAEFWLTNEDGSRVSSAFETNLNDNPVFRKMLAGWKDKLTSLTIDMEGEELRDYFRYLSSIHVPFKGGLTQTRRIQYLGYFNKGFIGMASPVEQPEETIQLLSRFAAVFNLTFTRFNDLKIAEANAQQAELDLLAIKAARQKAEAALTELQATQKQLIQSEKMASLGELTAGIAHEIQNPLNFVNNFSEVSNELIDEMEEELDKGNISEARAIASDIRQNLEKINHHGKRADAIVKGMLQHSRSSNGTKEPTNINALADEYLRLAYHGLRARDKSFNVSLKTDFDENVGKIDIIPQDIGRVILNLITNAFYAVAEKKQQFLSGYDPTVTVSTHRSDGIVEIKVSDNGNGIPQKVLEKIYQPFFTTKPSGQGTGLGLSMSYEIVTKSHGGELKVETKEGEGAEFTIVLPV